MEYDKVNRVLALYTKLMSGNMIYKLEEVQNWQVNERSIQRDIETIRAFLDTHPDGVPFHGSIVYDRVCKAYRLEETPKTKLTNSEILALCKILLDSRAFTKAEMMDLLDKLISGCVPKENQVMVRNLIKNEEFHYVELQHKTVFIDKIWDLGQAIQTSRYIEIVYERSSDKVLVTRRLKPAAIMFSEYYFYLTAFIDDDEVRQHFDVINDSFPTIYRIDRIKQLKVLDTPFHVPYKDRFEEGEFRKRIQFMFGGKLQRVVFTYTGHNIEAILDRLPTAIIKDETDGVYTISAEVFGKGINMWLRSQGDAVKVISMK